MFNSLIKNRVSVYHKFGGGPESGGPRPDNEERTDEEIVKELNELANKTGDNKEDEEIAEELKDLAESTGDSVEESDEKKYIKKQIKNLNGRIDKFNENRKTEENEDNQESEDKSGVIKGGIELEEKPKSEPEVPDEGSSSIEVSEEYEDEIEKTIDDFIDSLVMKLARDDIEMSGESINNEIEENLDEGLLDSVKDRIKELANKNNETKLFDDILEETGWGENSEYNFEKTKESAENKKPSWWKEGKSVISSKWNDLKDKVFSFFEKLNSSEPEEVSEDLGEVIQNRDIEVSKEYKEKIENFNSRLEKQENDTDEELDKVSESEWEEEWFEEGDNFEALDNKTTDSLHSVAPSGFIDRYKGKIAAGMISLGIFSATLDSGNKKIEDNSGDTAITSVENENENGLEETVDSLKDLFDTISNFDGVETNIGDIDFEKFAENDINIDELIEVLKSKKEQENEEIGYDDVINTLEESDLGLEEGVELDEVVLESESGSNNPSGYEDTPSSPAYEDADNAEPSQISLEEVINKENIGLLETRDIKDLKDVYINKTKNREDIKKNNEEYNKQEVDERISDSDFEFKNPSYKYMVHDMVKKGADPDDALAVAKQLHIKGVLEAVETALE